MFSTVERSTETNVAFLGIPIKASPIVKAWVITASVLIGETKKFVLKKKKKKRKKFKIPSLFYPHSYLSTNVNKIIPRLEILGYSVPSESLSSHIM